MPTKPKNISLSEFLEIGRQRGATDGLGDLARFLAEQGRDGVRAEGYRSGNVWVECAPVWWRHVDWEATNANSSPAPSWSWGYRSWGDGIDYLWPPLTESRSSSTASSNVVYFDLKGTEPPTPRRVERIELPRSAIDLVWPERMLGRPSQYDWEKLRQDVAPDIKSNLSIEKLGQAIQTAATKLGHKRMHPPTATRKAKEWRDNLNRDA